MSRDTIIQDIRAERERQVTDENWTEDHDDMAHKEGELALAAACYAIEAARPDTYFLHNRWRDIKSLWPWSSYWFKPKDKKRNLIKAGALIVAELERMERAEGRTPSGPLLDFKSLMNTPTIHDDQAKLRDEFNSNCPVGNKVIHRTGRGEVTLTVKTAAWMDSGDAVFQAEELAGMLMVSNVVGWQK